MRGSKAKALKKAIYGELPHKTKRSYQKINQRTKLVDNPNKPVVTGVIHMLRGMVAKWRGLNIPGKIAITTATIINVPGTPRALYQRAKRRLK